MRLQTLNMARQHGRWKYNYAYLFHFGHIMSKVHPKPHTLDLWDDQFNWLSAVCFMFLQNMQILSKQSEITRACFRHTRDFFLLHYWTQLSQFTASLSDKCDEIDRGLVVLVWHYLWQLHTTLHCHADIDWLLVRLRVCLQRAATGSCTSAWQQGV